MHITLGAKSAILRLAYFKPPGTSRKKSQKNTAILTTCISKGGEGLVRAREGGECPLPAPLNAPLHIGPRGTNEWVLLFSKAVLVTNLNQPLPYMGVVYKIPLT